MTIRQVCRFVVAGFALVLIFASGVGAKVVGRLTQVEGRVDLLKGGKLPATPLKVGDLVDAGDVLRSKSLSKAQITFIDNSIINISPRSRLAIEDYQFEPDQGKRWAVLKIFQGLAHVVVNKIYEVKEPDFIVKSNTAVTGVRGTDFGVRLLPYSSTILNFEGKTRVGNIFPEAHTWERRAPKIAFQPPGGGSFFVPGAFVDLEPMQGTTVQANLPPTLPYAISPLDRQMFMNQVATGQASYRGGSDSGVGTPAPSPGPMVPAVAPAGLTSGTGDTAVTLLNTVTVPPLVVPPQQTQSQSSPTPPTGGVAIPVFNILTTWGAGARDLDLHLTGPQDGGTFHVYYANRGSLTSQPYAFLNRDDTGTNGSEVITVQQFNQGGLYQASVFNYGDQSHTSTNLSTASGVSLSVINGGTVVNTNGGSTVNGGTVLISLTPTPNLAGNTWQAVSINPANGQITEVNQITNNGFYSATNGASALLAAPGATESAPVSLTAAPNPTAATTVAPSAANLTPTPAAATAAVAPTAAPVTLTATPVTPITATVAPAAVPVSLTATPVAPSTPTAVPIAAPSSPTAAPVTSGAAPSTTPGAPRASN